MRKVAPTPPGFEQLLQTGSGIGLFAGILPFIITYALFFFLIKQVDLLDEGNETFAAILAIAFAFYTSKFIIANPAYQSFLMNYVGRITLITVGVLGLIVVLAFLGLDLQDNVGGLKWILGLVAIVAFTVSGGIPVIAGKGALGQVTNFIYWLINSGTIWILAVIGLLAWTLRSGDEESGGGGGDLMDAFGGE